jgi:general secretion pathway protein L
MLAGPLSTPFGPLVGTLHDVLSWWRARMQELLPRRFAAADPAMAMALVAEPVAGQPGQVRLLRRRNGVETEAGRFGAGNETPLPLAPERREPVFLRLPSASVLARPVTLPLAAEGALDQVLRFEMDRLTPFSSDDVLFGWQDLARDRDTGRLSLTLLLVPRAPLRPVLDALDAAGLPPNAIEVAGARGARPLHIPLGGARATRGRLGPALAAGALVVVLLLCALPFVLQSMRQARLDHALSALQPQVAEAQAIRRRLAGSGAGAQALAAERNRLGDALGVLAAVTRVLPDDTYLSDLTLRGGTLTISGQSNTASGDGAGGRGAARLIPAMSADPAFSNPSFAAPVTRMDNNNAELFSLRATVSRDASAGAP